MKRVKWLLLFSLILNVIGLVFFVIGFSTHFWLESDKNYRTSSGFESLGLWEACFKDFSHKTSYNGKLYNGCWWMFSYEYEPIREWLNPPWLVAIQVMMTVSLLLQLVGSIIGVLVFLGVCPGVANFLALLSISVMTLVGGIISAVCLILFGVKSDQPQVEANWIYFPDKNFLSWSYALVAVSGFLSLFGSMCGFVAAMTARLEDKYGERPNYDGHMLRSPPTAY